MQQISFVAGNEDSMILLSIFLLSLLLFDLSIPDIDVKKIHIGLFPNGNLSKCFIKLLLQCYGVRYDELDVDSADSVYICSAKNR